MHSDSFSARPTITMGTKRRRSSSTGDVELVQKDINKAVELLTDDAVITKDKLLLPVKLEAIGTPSSIDSTEEPLLHSVTMVTQQSVTTDDIINLDSSVANGNKKSEF